MKKKKEVKFSVALGLFDYINPICYLITSISVILGLNGLIDMPLYIIYIIGAIISMIFGLTIPTVKLLVGLGKFKFKMPVNLVFYVNSGIFISSIALFKYVFKFNNYIMLGIICLSILILTLIYLKKRKFNTVAVLTGAVGYILIYSSLIKLALANRLYLSIGLYAIAIIFFLGLCAIGIKANLKDAKIHWIIETCNVLCQALVATSTALLFINMPTENYITDHEYLYDLSIDYILNENAKYDSKYGEDEENYMNFITYKEFGITEKETSKFIYMWVLDEFFYLEDGKVISDSGASVFTKCEYKDMHIVSCINPKDGNLYTKSLKEMCPDKNMVNKVLNYDLNISNEDKVNEYYKSK